MHIYIPAYTVYHVNWPNRVIVVVVVQRLAGRWVDSTLDQHTTLCTIWLVSGLKA